MCMSLCRLPVERLGSEVDYKLKGNLRALLVRVLTPTLMGSPLVAKVIV